MGFISHCYGVFGVKCLSFGVLCFMYLSSFVVDLSGSTVMLVSLGLDALRPPFV